MVKFNIDYDKEEDNLFLFSKKQSKGSVECGSLVLDFDKEGQLVGIELLNATVFLKESVDKANKSIVSSKFLDSLLGCKVEVKQQNNFLFIKLSLIGKERTISCPLNTPLIKEQSPAVV